MHIIGNDFGNWDWNAASVVSMNPVHSHEGHFWAIRYMTTTTEFKFCAEKAWNGDFAKLETNSGFVTPNNSMVEADGLYLIYVDLENSKVVVAPAKVYGIGDAFGGWDTLKEANLFAVAADGTASISTPAAGNLRMYAAYSGAEAGNWWQMEFNIYDGKIVYRAGGGDQEAVAVTAGQTVTLDFNKEAGSIQ